MAPCCSLAAPAHTKEECSLNCLGSLGVARSRSWQWAWLTIGTSTSFITTWAKHHLTNTCTCSPEVSTW